jgi:hypothetical protein
MSGDGPAVIAVSQPSAAAPVAAALRTDRSGGDDAPPAPAAGAGAPTVVTQAGKEEVVVGAAPAAAQEPDRDTVVPEAEVSAATEAQEDVPSVTAAPAGAPVVEAGMLRMDRLVWLGLGAAALGWLAHRAAWVGGVVPACSRFVVWKKREPREVVR